MKFTLILLTMLLAGCHVVPEPVTDGVLPAALIALILFNGLFYFTLLS